MSVEVLFPDDEEHFSRRPEPPLTEAELSFRRLLRDRRAYAKWCAEARARWAASRPAPAPPEKKRSPKRSAPKAPPKYNQKWDPSSQKAEK